MRKRIARLVLFLALAAGFPAAGAAQAPEPLLSVHRVTTEIAPGVRLCEQYRTGLTIAYEPEALLTLADVDSVRVGRMGEDGPFAVELALSAGGRAWLREFSAANVGRRIAIIVDGEAQAVPQIQRPLDLERLPVGHYDDEAHARRLAARLEAALERR